MGFESLTISSAAVKLTKPTSAKSFLGKLETAAVRARGDGTNPSATVGVLVASGEVVLLADSEIDRTAFIRDASTDATLQGHYYSAEASIIRAMIS